MDLFYRLNAMAFVIVIRFSESSTSFMQQGGGITGAGRLGVFGGSGLNAIGQSHGQHNGCKENC